MLHIYKAILDHSWVILLYQILILVLVEEFSSSDDEKLRDIEIGEHAFDKDREFYILNLEKSIVKGNVYRVSMQFVAKITHNLRGFYRSNYENDSGETE